MQDSCESGEVKIVKILGLGPLQVLKACHFKERKPCFKGPPLKIQVLPAGWWAMLLVTLLEGRLLVSFNDKE